MCVTVFSHPEVGAIGLSEEEAKTQAFLAYMEKMTVEEWRRVVWSHPVISEVLKGALESKS